MRSDPVLARDRRVDTRWPAGVAKFDLWWPGLNLRPELVDFSAGGLAFRVPPAVPLTLGGHVSLTLRTPRGIPAAQLLTRIASVAPQKEMWRVGGAIETITPTPKGNPRSVAPSDLLLLVAPEQKKQILSSVRKLGRWANLAIPGQADTEVTVLPEPGSDGGFYLEGPIPPIPSDASRARVRVSVGGACFAIEGSLRRDARGRHHLAWPLDVWSVSRRRCERTTLLTEAAIVRWEHPLDPGLELSAPVRDLSPHGIGITAPAATAPFPPTGCSKLTLDLDGERIELDGELAHMSVEGASVRFGLRTRAREPGDGLRIALACRRTQFPRLHSRRTASHKDLDALFEGSGYLDLRNGSRYTPTWNNPITDSHLSLDTVYRATDGSLLGHISCLRVYSRTWMYHQLATIGHSTDARACRSALYMDTASLVTFFGGDNWYSLAYFDRAKSWHQHFFGGLLEWVASDSLATILPLDRFDFAGPTLEEAPSRTNLAMGALAETEAAAATNLVRGFLPALAVEAMDLSEPLIAQNLRCEPAYSASGCERGRYPFALRDRGRIVGLALCEVGTRDLSIFNLLNMAHIYIDPGVDPAAQTTLLGHVRAFYASRGVHDPIVVAPPGVLSQAQRAGLALAETMGAIAISADGFRQYRNFLNFYLGRYARTSARGSDTP